MKANQVTLEEAFKRLQNGDKDAFDVVYWLTQKNVKRIAYIICQDYDKVESVIMDTYLEVLKKCCSLNDPGRAKQWIYSIAHNKAKNMLLKEA